MFTINKYLEEQQVIKMDEQELRRLMHKVTILRAEGRYKKTIEEGYRLLRIGENLQNYKAILVAQINIAASFYCIGDIPEAFHCMEQYEKICRTYGDDEDYLNLYNVMFLLYEYLKDFERAKETLKKSINLGEKLEKYNIVSNAFSNYSHICIVEGDYDKALKMGQLGLDAALKHTPKSEILEFRVKLNICYSLIRLGKLDKAKKMLDEMKTEPFLESFPREKAQCLTLEGHLLTEEEDFERAFQCYTRAKKIAESYEDLYLLKEIQEYRNTICEKMKDLEMGYQIQKEYIEILKKIDEKQMHLAALKLEIQNRLTELKQKADTDSLTGLYNRKYIENKANEVLEETIKKNQSLVCITFDIDNFKQINERFGHLFGDEVLIKIVERVKENIDGHLLGRFGGDEFVVILPGTALKEGREMTDRIKSAVESLQFFRDDQIFSVSVSLGVADSGKGKIKTFRELFELTEQRLYEAKKSTVEWDRQNKSG